MKPFHFFLAVGVSILLFVPLIKRSMDNKHRQFEEQLKKAFEQTYEEGYADGQKKGFKAGLKTCDDILESMDQQGRY